MSARNTFANAFVSFGTRFLAEEMNATVWPSVLSEGMMLSPFDCPGDVPTGWLARTVAGVQVTVVLEKPMQVLRTKMFSTPLPVLALRFEAFDANATISPSVLEAVVVLVP